MSDQPQFVPGIELAGAFYRDAVRPLLDADLEHSAALIGPGSEVLGFDTEMSRDHHWGPRVMLFLRSEDLASRWPRISERLAAQLPRAILGYPTSFTPPDPLDHGVQHLQATEEGAINHRVEAYTLEGYFERYLGIDLHDDPRPSVWLALPQQRLLAVTSGAVFHDDLGLEAVRKRLGWYPHDVWLYLLACGWHRIAQEEHLMGRAGFVGDELGSGLIGARLVRDVVRLAFLMEKRYAPYPKWLGTAFRQLDSSARLMPVLEAAVRARSWRGRERALCEGYSIVAQMHNALEITAPLPTAVSRFYGRPFKVIGGDRFAEAILCAITDPSVLKLRDRRIGSVDLFSDNTDLLDNPRLHAALTSLFD